MRAVCVLLVVVSCLPASPRALSTDTEVTNPVAVSDTCAHCHPPLALPEGHPAPQSYAFEACRTCHVDADRKKSGVDASLLRTMHLGHIEEIGFDCTLCHVDAESDVPRLRMQLDALLQSREPEQGENFE